MPKIAAEVDQSYGPTQHFEVGRGGGGSGTRWRRAGEGSRRGDEARPGCGKGTSEEIYRGCRWHQTFPSRLGRRKTDSVRGALGPEYRLVGVPDDRLGRPQFALRWL